MKLVELSKIDRHEIYNTHIVNDFPASEVKPLHMIEKLIESDQYLCYGFYNDLELLGYVFLVKPSQSGSILLDYLAVCSGNRSNGLGTEFIRILKEKFSTDYVSLLAEVEHPDYSISEQDKKDRMRRIYFYQKNGFQVSDVSTRVLSDDYRIINLSLNGKIKDSEIALEMNNIYNIIFGQEFFNKHISLSV